MIFLEVERRLDVVARDRAVRIRDDDAREGDGDHEGQGDQRDRAEASAHGGVGRTLVELDDTAPAFAARASGHVRGPGDGNDHGEQADRQGEGGLLGAPDNAEEAQDADGSKRPRRSLGAQHDGERDEGGDQGAQEGHDRRPDEDAGGRLNGQQVLPRGDRADDQHLDCSLRGQDVVGGRCGQGEGATG